MHWHAMLCEHPRSLYRWWLLPVCDAEEVRSAGITRLPASLGRPLLDALSTATRAVGVADLRLPTPQMRAYSPPTEQDVIGFEATIRAARFKVYVLEWTLGKAKHALRGFTGGDKSKVVAVARFALGNTNTGAAMALPGPMQWRRHSIAGTAPALQATTQPYTQPASSTGIGGLGTVAGVPVAALHLQPPLRVPQQGGQPAAPLQLPVSDRVAPTPGERRSAPSRPSGRSSGAARRRRYSSSSSIIAAAKKEVGVASSDASPLGQRATSAVGGLRQRTWSVPAADQAASADDAFQIELTEELAQAANAVASTTRSRRNSSASTSSPVASKPTPPRSRRPSNSSASSSPLTSRRSRRNSKGSNGSPSRRQLRRVTSNTSNSSPADSPANGLSRSASRDSLGSSASDASVWSSVSQRQPGKSRPFPQWSEAEEAALQQALQREAAIERSVEAAGTGEGDDPASGVLPGTFSSPYRRRAQSGTRHGMVQRLATLPPGTSSMAAPSGRASDTLLPAVVDSVGRAPARNTAGSVSLPAVGPSSGPPRAAAMQHQGSGQGRNGMVGAPSMPMHPGHTWQGPVGIVGGFTGIPGMPGMAGMPGMPPMAGMPGLLGMPGMPGMPSMPGMHAMAGMPVGGMMGMPGMPGGVPMSMPMGMQTMNNFDPRAMAPRQMGQPMVPTGNLWPQPPQQAPPSRHRRGSNHRRRHGRRMR